MRRKLWQWCKEIDGKEEAAPDHAEERPPGAGMTLSRGGTEHHESQMIGNLRRPPREDHHRDRLCWQHPGLTDGTQSRSSVQGPLTAGCGRSVGKLGGGRNVRERQRHPAHVEAALKGALERPTAGG